MQQVFTDGAAGMELLPWILPIVSFFSDGNTSHGPAFSPEWMSPLGTLMPKAGNTPLPAAFALVTFRALGHASCLA